MLKRAHFLAAGILAVVIIIGVVMSVSAAGGWIQIMVSMSPINVVVNGEEKTPPDDMKPMNYNGRVFVALRFVAEALGKDVNWDDDTKTVIIEDNEFVFFASSEYHAIQRLSWQFFRACLSDDTQTMKSLSTEDLEIDITLNIFNNLGSFMVKNIFPHKEDEHVDIRDLTSENVDSYEYIVSCEFYEKGDDSFTYLVTSVAKIDGEWKVTLYGFDK